MNYSLRASNPFGYLPASNYSNNNYGRIVDGNEHNSYGPYIDPELDRRPQRRITPLNLKHRRMTGGY